MRSLAHFNVIFAKVIHMAQLTVACRRVNMHMIAVFDAETFRQDFL